MKALIVIVMLFSFGAVLWQLFSGFSKKLLAKDINRIASGEKRHQRTFFHQVEIILLILVIGLLWWIQLNFVWMIHLHFHPDDLSFSEIMRSQDYRRYSVGRDIRLLLMFVPGSLGSVPLAALFFNYVELSIPKLKQLALRSLEKSNIPMEEMMGPIIGITFLMVPLCLFLELLGAIL